MFAPYGETHSAIIINDRETGRSRGFGFVELDDAAADKAVEELNGTEYGSRQLKINEARERPKRTGGRW